MAIPLKYNTASQEIPLGYFLDSTDGDTEETGLTIANTDIKLWKSGATTLANKNSGGATHISNGIYYCVLDATDTNTYGSLVIFIHVSGALAIRVECWVMEADAYDALYAAAGTGHIEANTVQISGDATAANNAELAFDGTGYGFTNCTMPTVTTLTGNTAQTADNDTKLTSILSLLDDARGEPGDIAPPVNPDLATKIDYLYKFLRNKIETTSTRIHVYDDAGTNKDHTSTINDDGATFTRGEFAAGDA